MGRIDVFEGTSSQKEAICKAEEFINHYTLSDIEAEATGRWLTIRRNGEIIFSVASISKMVKIIQIVGSAYRAGQTEALNNLHEDHSTNHSENNQTKDDGRR